MLVVESIPCRLCLILFLIFFFVFHRLLVSVKLSRLATFLIACRASKGLARPSRLNRSRWVMPERSSVEYEILTRLDLAPLEEAERHVSAPGSINESYRLRIFLELVIGCLDTDAVHPRQVELHRSVRIIALKPAIKEATMYLL